MNSLVFLLSGIALFENVAGGGDHSDQKGVPGKLRPVSVGWTSSVA